MNAKMLLDALESARRALLTVQTSIVSTFPTHNLEKHLLYDVVERYGNVPCEVQVHYQREHNRPNEVQLIVVLGEWADASGALFILERVEERVLDEAPTPRAAYEILRDRLLSAIYPYIEHDEDEEE